MVGLGFLRRGERGGGGGNLLICQILPKNCMKMKQFGLEGPMDPPLALRGRPT